MAEETWSRDWIGERNERIKKYNYLLSDDILNSVPNSNNTIIGGIGGNNPVVSPSDNTAQLNALWNKAKSIFNSLEDPNLNKTI